MDELMPLYRRWENRIKDITKLFPDEDIEGPHLVHVTEKYKASKCKIAIFGQQTNGWYCNYDDIDAQINGYIEFNLGEKYRSTPFWDFVRRVEKEVNDDLYSSVWLNLNKFDMDSNRPCQEVERIISALDPLTCEEVKIVNPDVTIFLTGPNYDGRIKSIFPDCTFTQIGDFNQRTFCFIKSKYLPEKSIRIYHPGYLRRAKIEDYMLKQVIGIIRD